MLNLLKKYVYPWFVDAASLASIIGLIATFAKGEYAVIISLSAFCLVLTILLVGCIVTINKIINTNHPEEYRKVSSFYVFKTEDGVKSSFETYRLIQSKRALLTQIEYKYKWTGDIAPVISSKNQDIEQLPPNKDANTWDKAIIKFKKPLAYNESTVLHIKSENDDANNTAKPWIECRLDSPIEIMQFRVLLGYKPNGFNQKAVFKRKKLNSEVSSNDYEVLCSVDFDEKYKQYYHVIVNPDPGYNYRLEWEK